MAMSELGRNVVVAVTSGVIALVTALAVTRLTAENGNAQLAAQLQESRAAEARAKNAAIYQEVLAAGDAIFRTLEPYAACVRRLDSRSRCVGPYRAAVSRWDKALNALYVYGSDAAWVASINMANALVDAANAAGKQGGPNETPYLGTYAGLQRIMCRELSTSPGARCGHPPRHKLK
jgi:hypothetical protein